MQTFNTEFALAYQAECFPPDLDNEVRKGRTVLSRIGVRNASADLAFAGYLVWRKLGDLKNAGYDYEAEDYLAVGEVSDMITDRDGVLLAQFDECIRNRVACGSIVGGMTIEISAIHDLLLEAGGALAASWAEKEEGL